MKRFSNLGLFHTSVNVAYYYYELNCPYREIFRLIIEAKFKRHINHHWSSFCVFILKLLLYFRLNCRERPMIANSLVSSIHLCLARNLLPSIFPSMIFRNLAWPSDDVLYWTEEYYETFQFIYSLTQTNSGVDRIRKRPKFNTKIHLKYGPIPCHLIVCSEWGKTPNN